MPSDAIEGAKILVWGQVGEQLKEKDENRLLAIAQKDPNYFLAIISNQEIEIIIRDILDKGELTKESMKLIMKTNQLDDIFRQISDFMTESPDMVSIGSFLTGEFDEKTAGMIIPKKSRESGD